jgi:excisionase family DNA binding protein
MENIPFNVNPSKVYTVNEVADIIRMSKQTVTREIREGNISSYKLGDRTYRVMGNDLISYLNTRHFEADTK